MDYSWILGSWRDHVIPLWLNPLLAVTAVACGLLVGGERQRYEKPAGLRTLSLVCLGAAVFTMLSFCFANGGDTGRVAAQIVTGVGFLGAGVIMHGRRIVSGVTTAAIIWVSAAIGMTVGAGYVFAGLLLSGLVNRLMVGVFLYETRWHPDLHDIVYELEYGFHGGLTRIRLQRIVVDYEMGRGKMEWSEPSGETARVTLRLRMARIHLYEMLGELADVPDVRSMTLVRLEKVKETTPT